MEKLAARPVQEAVEFLRRFSPEAPSAAIVLGSGVRVFEEMEESRSLPFKEVFGVSPGVVGHAGSLSLGRVAGKLVCVLRGRFHCYEGHSWDIVTLPAQVLIEWGVPKLFLTNAAGGINQNFQVGDLMVITSFRDHLNSSYKETGLLPQLAKEPVLCRNRLSDALIDISRSLHQKDSTFRPLQAGAYAGLLGPNYETLAEIEMLKFLKADAVGMSTVPELLSCQGSNTEAAAISVITNVWKPDEAVGGHEEVLEAARAASERLDLILKEAVML